MSGSLWFYDFMEYCKRNDYRKLPDKIYFSLGDKEANTRNPILKTVEDMLWYNILVTARSNKI